MIHSFRQTFPTTFIQSCMVQHVRCYMLTLHVLLSSGDLHEPLLLQSFLKFLINCLRVVSNLLHEFQNAVSVVIRENLDLLVWETQDCIIRATWRSTRMSRTNSAVNRLHNAKLHYTKFLHFPSLIETNLDKWRKACIYHALLLSNWY